MSFISKLLEPNISALENSRNTKKLIHLLKRNLKSTNDLDVRVHAALALSNIGDASAIEPIRQCLKEIEELEKREKAISSASLAVQMGDLATITKNALLAASIRDISQALYRLESLAKG